MRATSIGADTTGKKCVLSAAGTLDLTVALVASGCTRDEAYRIVQRDARQAFETRGAFRSVLEADEELIARLGADSLEGVLDQAFDLDRALQHTHRTIDALSEVKG